MIDDLFRSRNIKLTNQRKKIYNLIREKEQVTLKYIVSNCKNINITTIYRVLDMFLDKKLIIKKINLDNEIYYEILPDKHIHYISCIKCHEKNIINEEKIEKFEKNITKDYMLISHNIEFIGICKKCMEKHV